MNITMLGTGNAMVTECYNTCFVLEDGDKHLLVDGGGGNTLLRQLKQAGFDWKDMREIFVTHKHVDHIMGVVWMIRMICQNMKQGQYDGEATIYGHEEVIRILKEMAEMLYPAKQTCFIGDRLHLVVVNDMPGTANGFFMKHSVCMIRRIFFTHMRNIIQRQKMPVNWQNSWECRI